MFHEWKTTKDLALYLTRLDADVRFRLQRWTGFGDKSSRYALEQSNGILKGDQDGIPADAGEKLFAQWPKNEWGYMRGTKTAKQLAGMLGVKDWQARHDAYKAEVKREQAISHNRGLQQELTAITERINNAGRVWAADLDTFNSFRLSMAREKLELITASAGLAIVELERQQEQAKADFLAQYGAILPEEEQPQ